MDTTIFNQGIFQENILVVVDDYNENLDQPIDEEVSDEESGDYVSDISNEEDLNNLLSEGSENATNEDDASTDLLDNNEEDVNNGDVADESIDDNTMDSSDDMGPDDMDSNTQQELSFEDCQNLAKEEVLNNSNLGPQFTIDELNHDEIPDCYVFFVMDDTNTKVAEITVNALTSQIDTKLI